MNRTQTIAIEDISTALGVSLENFHADDWKINEQDENIAIFVSSHPDLEKFTGDIIDYKIKKLILKHPKITAVDTIPESFADGTEFMIGVDGTGVIVFRYKGTTYYKTARRLNIEKNKRAGVPDYRKYYELLGGPKELGLFGGAESATYYYIFNMLVPDTSLVSKLPYNYENNRLIITGHGKLETYKEGSARPHPRYKPVDLTISKEEAIAIYNGDMNPDIVRKYKIGSHPEILYYKVDGQIFKCESENFKWRCNVRGNDYKTENRFHMLFFSLEISTDGTLLFNNETFTPLKSILVGMGDELPETWGTKLPETWGTIVPIRSNSQELYDKTVSFATHYLNLVNVVAIHLKEAVSPLKYDDVETTKKHFLSIPNNMLTYFQYQLGISSVNFVPTVSLENGYVPSSPDRTLEKPVAHLRSLSKMLDTAELLEFCCQWLCWCDCKDQAYLAKYFGILNISPSNNMARHNPATSRDLMH